MNRLLPVLALALLAPVLWTEEPNSAPKEAQPAEASGPLLAYVGTFSSPLRDTLPFQEWTFPLAMAAAFTSFKSIARTGEMTPAAVHEMGTSPGAAWL